MNPRDKRQDRDFPALKPRADEIVKLGSRPAGETGNGAVVHEREIATSTELLITSIQSPYVYQSSVHECKDVNEIFRATVVGPFRHSSVIAGMAIIRV